MSWHGCKRGTDRTEQQANRPDRTAASRAILCAVADDPRLEQFRSRRERALRLHSELKRAVQGACLHAAAVCADAAATIRRMARNRELRQRAHADSDMRRSVNGQRE